MDLGNVLDAGMTFVRAELENVRRFEVPWRRRLWLYRHGFLSSKDAIWELSDGRVDRYLSDLEYRRLGRLGRPYGDGLDNKLLFHALLSGVDEPLLPTVHGLVRDGRFVDLPWFECIGSVEELRERATDEPLVCKPVTAAKGDGVRVLDWKGGTLRIDGNPVEPGDVRSALASDRDLLLTEHVTQAQYAAQIYPDTTNTVRMLTMVDPRTEEPFVGSAVHRFGTAESGRVDNWSRGGVSAGIEPRTGELGPAVREADPEDGTTRWMDTHPDTDARITGTVLPAWDRIRETILEVAARYAGLWPHVGWDVVVTDDEGSIRILEGERRSVDADQQAHGPLLASERTRRFYEHHDVLTSTRRGLDT